MGVASKGAWLPEGRGKEAGMGEEEEEERGVIDGKGREGKIEMEKTKM